MINFRRNVLAGTGVELRYQMKRKGWLTTGLMHFPAGCNSLVQVKVSLIRRETPLVKEEIAPIDELFIALDDTTFPFIVDQKVTLNDEIVVEIANTDGANPHQISVIMTWASIRSIPEIAEIIAEGA